MTAILSLFSRGLFVAASTALLACGTSVVEDTGAGGQGGGQGGAGGGPDCTIEPPGAAFQFVIRNVGNRELGLTFGCGETLPIVIDTAAGPRGIGAGSGDYCEVSCDAVYDGYENWGCSDCGPGGGTALLPGGLVTIDWDRRVYIPHEAPAACTGHESGNGCALGVPPGDATSGTLTFCTDSQSAGYCYGDEESLAFALDLGLASVIIDVQ